MKNIKFQKTVNKTKKEVKKRKLTSFESSDDQVLVLMI